MISLKPRLSTWVFGFLIASLFVGFWLRVNRLDTWPPGASTDESYLTLYAAYFGETGRLTMYEHLSSAEPLFLVVQALGARLFGATVWAFRYVSVLLGTVTIALTIWCVRECLHDWPPMERRLAMLTAAGVLATSLGHIALSRSLYRGLLQPACMLVWIGFLMRGLRRKELTSLWLSGLAFSGAIYSYLAALVLPGAMILLASAFLVFEHRKWRDWLPLVLGWSIPVVVTLAPLAWLLWADPTAVLSRATDVSGGGLALTQLLRVYFGAGDINPQYNVASAPLLPVWLSPFFGLGLVVMIWRLSPPRAIFFLSLSVVVALPVLASNEIPHGLRIVGAFAIVPLFIGSGLATLWHWGARWSLQSFQRRLAWPALSLIGTALVTSALWASHIYITYWQIPATWVMFDRPLPRADWFFRTDRRDFAHWIQQQTTPLLVPAAELDLPTTRLWLLADYPSSSISLIARALPAGTQWIMPRSIESDQPNRETRDFVLINAGTLTLLPPVTTATSEALAQLLPTATTVVDNAGRPLVDVAPLPPTFTLAFLPNNAPSDIEHPLAEFENGLAIVGWRGPSELLAYTQQTIPFTIDWATQYPQTHIYGSEVQILNQDGATARARAGGRIWPHLFPSLVWTPQVEVSAPYWVGIPANLEPGAYRLAVGSYLIPNQLLPVRSASSEGLGNQWATVGWLKVPLPPVEELMTDHVVITATLGTEFKLYGATVRAGDDGRMRLLLFWEALSDRPALDATIFIHVQAPTGELVAQDDARPLGGQYPTFIWSQGEHILTEHWLSVPLELQEQATVYVGMYTFPTMERLPAEQNEEPRPDQRLNLGTLLDLQPKP